jgi:hypothetical protein
MKACIDTSLSHGDVAKEAQLRYPLTPKRDALYLLWMFYGEIASKKNQTEAYAAHLRFKLLCLFILAPERNN